MQFYSRFYVYSFILFSIFFLPSFSFAENDLSKIPIPVINPTGDLAAYRSVSHNPDRSRDFEFPGPVVPIPSVLYSVLINGLLMQHTSYQLQVQYNFFDQFCCFVDGYWVWEKKR